jgi:hypothetical protein
MTSGLRCKNASIVAGICVLLRAAQSIAADDTRALLVQTIESLAATIRLPITAPV